MWQYKITACPTQLRVIGAQFSPRNSNHYYTTYLRLSKGFCLLFTYKLMTRTKGKIVRWRPISKFLSVTNNIIELSSFLWLNLLIIMQKMLVPITHLLSSTAVFTLKHLIKKTLILAHSQIQKIN